VHVSDVLRASAVLSVEIRLNLDAFCFMIWREREKCHLGVPQ
jgi:hypothetical protein